MGRAHQFRGSDWKFVATSVSPSSQQQQEIPFCPASTDLERVHLIKRRRCVDPPPPAPRGPASSPTVGNTRCGQIQSRSLVSWPSGYLYGLQAKGRNGLGTLRVSVHKPAAASREGWRGHVLGCGCLCNQLPRRLARTALLRTARGCYSPLRPGKRGSPAVHTGEGGGEDHLIEQRGLSSCLRSTQIGEWEFGKFPN